MGMIMITHDLGIIAEVCDEVSVVYAGRVIEHGNLVDVFDHTLHPYTEGLFNSLPDIDNRERELIPIPRQPACWLPLCPPLPLCHAQVRGGAAGGEVGQRHSLCGLLQI